MNKMNTLLRLGASCTGSGGVSEFTNPISLGCDVYAIREWLGHDCAKLSRNMMGSEAMTATGTRAPHYRSGRRATLNVRDEDTPPAHPLYTLILPPVDSSTSYAQNT
ncbi:hypothetical protein CBL_05431 [Carabus blaptoides fortunei]